MALPEIGVNVQIFESGNHGRKKIAFLAAEKYPSTLMHVAITGAAGHLGAALVRQLLENGHSVSALVFHDDRALRGLPVTRVRGNLHDPETLRRLCDGAEVVQHLAGRISIGEVPERELWRTNVEGVRQLLEACQTTSVRRLIYFSSAHAFKSRPGAEVLDESAPLTQGFPYERSKAAAQAMVLAASGQSGLETLSLNPTSVLGPWDYKPSLQGRMLLDLYRGKIPVLSPGGYDWVDNRDIARAAVASMTQGRTGEAYLLSGRYATLLDLAAMFGQITGKPVPRRTIPFWLLRPLAPVAGWWGNLTGQRPLFTREALSHVETGHWKISHEKAARELGYRARPLEETLQDTWEWLGKNH